MEWYVYYDNINKKEITRFNIFDHGGFLQDFLKIVSSAHTKEYFSELLRKSLMYYFWSRAEYEVQIYPWPAKSLYDPHLKVDIFGQIIMNWQAFVDYTWAHRHEVREMKGAST